MGIMKANLVRHAHDTTFSPVGLYNFVKGSELVDSSANGKDLTEQDAPTDDVDFIHGAAEGLINFGLYRNDTTDFQYTGAMSYCCLVHTTGFIPDGTTNTAQLGTWEHVPSVDQRWGLQIKSTGHIRYVPQDGVTTYEAVADRKIREHHKWHHVVFTRDSAGTGIKLYFNGVNIHSSTVGGAPGTSGTGYFSIGELHAYSGSINTIAAVSSCAIYAAELTADQIKYLARKTLGYSEVPN